MRVGSVSKLDALGRATREKKTAAILWEAALKAAIQSGRHSEREIARAAGISGPAVSARKKRIADDPCSCAGSRDLDCAVHGDPLGDQDPSS